jgi:hypothetical protein
VTKTMLDAPVALGVGSWGWRAEVAGQTGCKTFPVRTVVLAAGARCGAAPGGAADEVGMLGALHGPAFHLDVFSLGSCVRVTRRDDSCNVASVLIRPII